MSGPAGALARAQLRRGLRALAAHAFDLGVLLPIVGLAFLLIAGRSLELFRAPLAALLAADDAGPTALTALACGLAAAFWPGSWRALYGRGANVELLDVLPIPEKSRFAALLLALPFRALPLALLWTAGAYVLADVGRVEISLAGVLALAWPAMLLLASLALALAQLAAHTGVARASWLAIAFAVLLLLAISPWGGFVAWPCRMAGELLRLGWAQAAGVALVASPPWGGWLAAEAATLLVAAGLFRFRRADLARAGAQAEAGLPLPRLAGRGGRGERRLLRALVRRDLLLVARFFSPAVPITLAIALLTLLALLRTLAGLPLEGPRALADYQRLAVALSVAALLPWLSLAPFLLSRHLRLGWQDSMLGAPHELLVRAGWRTPLWLALPPALPALAVALGVTAYRLGNPAMVATLAIQIVSALTMIATIVGLAAWEIPHQPLLSALYGWILGGLFLGLVVIAPHLLLIWLALFAWLFTQLRARALARAQFLELGP